MLVSEVPSGCVIRVCLFPNDVNGDLYKVGEFASVMSFRYARTRFTGRRVTLAGHNRCEIVAKSGKAFIIDGF